MDVILRRHKSQTQNRNIKPSLVCYLMRFPDGQLFGFSRTRHCEYLKEKQSTRLSEEITWKSIKQLAEGGD